MKLILLLIILGILLVTLGISEYFNGFEKKGIVGFELKDEFFEGDITRKVILENRDEIIRFSIINNLDKKSSNNLIKVETYTLEAIYDSEISPYPGVISDEISCEDEFIPKRKEINKGDNKIIYYETFLSGRFSYGGCVEDLIEYRGIIAWTYCEDKKEYRKMEYMVDKNKEINNEIVFVNICKKI